MFMRVWCVWAVLLTACGLWMLPALSIKLHSLGFSEVIALARAYSGRTPAVAAATAAYRITVVAVALTPAASISKIDASLSAISSPARLKSGALSKNKKRQRENVAVTEGGPATRLVLARMHMGSRYNRLTGWYWAINRHEFSPGQGQAGFLRKVYDTAVRMVKARHSSPNFLKTGWFKPLDELAASGLLSKSTMRGLGARPPSRRSKQIANSGYANLPIQGINTRVEVGNRIGMESTNVILAEKHNVALHRYGGPALERAKLQEFNSTIDYILREEARKTFAPARQYGVIIDV